jgi:uncharacterized protein (DUF1800 family)
MRRLAPALLAVGALTGGVAPALGAGAPHGVHAAPEPPPRGAPALAGDARILHVLNRLAFGPRPGDVERVRAVGVEAWIERQLHPETLDDASTDRALATLPSLRLSIPEALRDYPRPDPKLREKLQNGQMTRAEMMEMSPPEKRPIRIAAELQAAKMLRAVESPRQLAEVMVDFWFNHFNVFAGKGDVRWYVSAYERDVIRPNALGHFSDLVRASARHPAMLFYLDNWLSARPDFTVPAGPNRGRKAGLNENYARELMELHTLGVDGGYTQTDVTEVARAFTGWSIDRPHTEGRFVFRPRMHDRGEKVVLSQRIPAGGGEDDGERVLAILTRHPSTARFIATKLVRRFVADTPPPGLVARVAATYLKTDGDIRAMLRTIVASPEFLSADASRAKVKTPFEFVASAARALGATVDARGAFALARATAEIGEPLYQAQPPTGYPDRAEAWVNSGALLARMNFALALAGGRYPGAAVDPSALLAGANAQSPDVVLDRLLAALVAGQASADTRAVLAAQLGNTTITRPTADDRDPTPTDVAKLAALVLGSPEFQRR